MDNIKNTKKDNPVIGVSKTFFNFFKSYKSEEVPQDLIGAQIINIGAPIEEKEREGGLVIDYKTKEGLIKRIILEFNELCMWVAD